jgi:hypothetical protein
MIDATRCHMPSLLAALLLAWSNHANACRAAPAGQLMDPDQQLAEAHDVVLATVTGWSPASFGETPIAFTVVKRLAGAVTGNFVITGTLQDDERHIDHADPAFWNRGGGRTRNGPDCMIHPTFAMGATYLVFHDGPVTWRSYERIGVDVFGRPDPFDKWLAYVSEKSGTRP